MFVVKTVRNALRLLVPLAVACTIYLYLYPFFSQCAFPLPSRDAKDAFEDTKKLHWPYANADADTQGLPTKRAPFRLLTFGDPQLEGDTSIPISYMGVFPHVVKVFHHVTFQSSHWCFRERVRMTIHDAIDIIMEDIPYLVESLRKMFDLFGNDFYLGHIYHTLHWWTGPTHVTVLGDLLGSQWIEDDEFERRADRFWNRTFSGGLRVPDEIAQYPSKEYNVTGVLDGSVEEEIWTKRIVNVAGNHDIGYAGDLTEERMQRFERLFGKANYELRFRLPVTDPLSLQTIYNESTNPYSKRLTPELRLVILNDMNLDTPAKSQALQDQTYEFINQAIGSAPSVDQDGHFTLLLTHIPLYKPEGVCVDAPFFDFHGAHDGGGVKEQYLLSGDASKGLLEGLFGMSGDSNAAGNGVGRKGLILNGHDHEGCDTYHFINQTNGTNAWERSWEQVTWLKASTRAIPGQLGVQGRREITVRSMMGDFGGNAGLLSMWFNFTTWEWEYEYMSCPLGTQHFWWFVHLFDVGVIILGVLYVVALGLTSAGTDLDVKFAQLLESSKKAGAQTKAYGQKAKRVWNAAVAEARK